MVKIVWALSALATSCQAVASSEPNFYHTDAYRMLQWRRDLEEVDGLAINLKKRRKRNRRPAQKNKKRNQGPQGKSNRQSAINSMISVIEDTNNDQKGFGVADIETHRIAGEKNCFMTGYRPGSSTGCRKEDLENDPRTHKEANKEKWAEKKAAQEEQEKEKDAQIIANYKAADTAPPGAAGPRNEFVEVTYLAETESSNIKAHIRKCFRDELYNRYSDMTYAELEAHCRLLRPVQGEYVDMCEELRLAKNKGAKMAKGLYKQQLANFYAGIDLKPTVDYGELCKYARNWVAENPLPINVFGPGFNDGPGGPGGPGLDASKSLSDEEADAACSAMGCSHACFINSMDQAECACMYGFNILVAEGKTCIRQTTDTFTNEEGYWVANTWLANGDDAVTDPDGNTINDCVAFDLLTEKLIVLECGNAYFSDRWDYNPVSKLISPIFYPGKCVSRGSELEPQLSLVPCDMYDSMQKWSYDSDRNLVIVDNYEGDKFNCVLQHEFGGDLNVMNMPVCY